MEHKDRTLCCCLKQGRHYPRLILQRYQIDLKLDTTRSYDSFIRKKVKKANMPEVSNTPSSEQPSFVHIPPHAPEDNDEDDEDTDLSERKQTPTYVHKTPETPTNQTTQMANPPRTLPTPTTTTTSTRSGRVVHAPERLDLTGGSTRFKADSKWQSNHVENDVDDVLQTVLVTNKNVRNLYEGYSVMDISEISKET